MILKIFENYFGLGCDQELSGLGSSVGLWSGYFPFSVTTGKTVNSKTINSRKN